MLRVLVALTSCWVSAGDFGCKHVVEAAAARTWGSRAEQQACAVKDLPTDRDFRLLLRGHPHSGTNWAGRLVSTMLFLASNYDDRDTLFAMYASARTTTHNITFDSREKKHNIDKMRLMSPGGGWKLAPHFKQALPPELARCRGKPWAELEKECLRPLRPAAERPANYLLLFRDPIRICVSNSKAETQAAAFATCDSEIEDLGIMLAARYYWFTTVLPRDANTSTFTWWYGEDDVASCAGLLGFLGFRSSVGDAICEPAVFLNSRATDAAVMGLSTPGKGATQRQQHGVNHVEDDLAALEARLPPGAVPTLAARVLPILPPAARGRWAAAYGV